MKKIVKFVLYTLFVVFTILVTFLLVDLIVEILIQIGIIDAKSNILEKIGNIINLESIRNYIIPLSTTGIPVIATYYFDNKTDHDNLKRALEMLERHRKDNCIGASGQKIKDGTTDEGYNIEYSFIVNNWNKRTKKILKLAKENPYLKKKSEGPEQWVKNHFLGKEFN